MPASMPDQLIVFAWIALLVLVVIMVFLIISAVYFFNLMNFKPPTQGEATFLFATAVILAIVLFIIAIWALWGIYDYYSMVTPVVAAPVVATPVVATPVAVRPTPVAVQQPLMVQPIAQPVVTEAPSVYSTTFSASPIAYPQQVALGQEIYGVQSAYTA